MSEAGCPPGSSTTLGRTQAGPSLVSEELAPRGALQDCLAVMNRYLLLPEDTVVLYLLALVVANRLPGDPVWGFIVAPSGGAKTELLNSLSEIPETYALSDLTPQTFLSGYTKKTQAGLLQRLEYGTVLVLKDFTTVLSMHRDSRRVILSQLREIADGSYRKEFGTGETIAWEGKVGFIAGVTPVIDDYRSVYAVLGERFLQLRPPVPARTKLARAARRQVGTETEMRKQLRTAMARCVEGVRLDRVPHWQEELGTAVDNLSTLCALARSGTVRDPYRKDLQLVPEPEVPTRLVKQLVKLGQGLAMLGGSLRVGAKEYEIVRRVALDTIPQIRWRVLSCLLQEEEVPTTEVARTIGLPVNTARGHLEDLVGLGLGRVRKGEVGRAHRWSVTPLCSQLAASSGTLPHKSYLGGMGECKD
jgi:hypothetical protein